MAAPPPIIDVLFAGESLDEIRRQLAAALDEDPPRIPSTLFYDRVGSELFDRITELPEYYLTRTERGLLEQFADDIAVRTGARDVVELGAGSAPKTRILLDALQDRGTLERYVPFDVSEEALRSAASRMAEAYPELTVHGVVGEFDAHLSELPVGEDRLFLFLGSTIGNFRHEEAAGLLDAVRKSMGPRDRLLLGVDRVKPVETVEAAYNDSAGVTAEFNRNILQVANRLAEGDADPQDFEHLAVWLPRERRIEMRLVARRPLTVRFDAIDRTLALQTGEHIVTEISTKYERSRVLALLAASGLDLDYWYESTDGAFALVLARPGD